MEIYQNKHETSKWLPQDEVWLQVQTFIHEFTQGFLGIISSGNSINNSGETVYGIFKSTEYY